MISTILVIDFARIAEVAFNFLAKTNAGFRRIGGRDSLLGKVFERRL